MTGQVIDNQYIQQRFVACTRRTIKCHICLGVIILLVGFAVIVIGFSWPERSIDKLLSVFSGVSLSAFTSFPLKEIRSRQEKIEMIQGIGGASAPAEDRARINELLWKALEKTIVG